MITIYEIDDLYINRCECGAKRWITARALVRYYNNPRQQKTIKAICEFGHVTRLKIDDDLKHKLDFFYSQYIED